MVEVKLQLVLEGEKRRCAKRSWCEKKGRRFIVGD